MAFTLTLALIAPAVNAAPAAAQDPPGCAAAPAAPPAGDPINEQWELRQLRRETAENCAAIVAALTSISADADRGADAASELAAAAGAADGLAVHETADAPPPSTATVELGEDTRTWQGDLSSADQSVVWFLTGTLIALFFAHFLIRNEA